MAITLTLLMLLFVLLAAFVFTFQAQRTLNAQVNTLQATAADVQLAATRTADTLNVVEATRAATADLLVTTEADAVALEGQLVARQQEIEQLNEELAIAQSALLTATSDLSQYEQQFWAQPPLVTAALLETVVAPGQSAHLWVAASDLAGLERVDVDVAGFTTSYLAAGSRLFTRQITQTIEAAGSYTITVTAVKANSTLSSSTTTTLLVAPPPAAPIVTPAFLPITETAVFCNGSSGFGWQQQPAGLAFFWQQTWDDDAALSAYETAYAAYANQRYGRTNRESIADGLCWRGDEAACLFTQENVTLLIVAPDVETAVSLSTTMPQNP